MRKSTSVAMEIRALEGIHVDQVALGQAHTLMIARDSTDEEKAKVDQLPVYSP